MNTHLCLIAVTFASTAHAQIFLGLGSLPAGSGQSNESVAAAISADGTTVVGMSTSSQTVQRQAFRWALGEGMVGLLGIAGSDVNSAGLGVNSNGTVIVGAGLAPNGQDGTVWVGDQSPISLGVMTTQATAISDDSSTIVGIGDFIEGRQAFRTLDGVTIETLGDLPGGTVSSRAFDTSADGSTIVGGSASAMGGEAFVWTETGGMVGLGDLPGGGFGSTAEAISGNAQVVVGGGSGVNGPEAFRWTAAAGFLGLGDLPGGSFSSNALGSNFDGSVVVGEATGSDGSEAFFWTEELGMVSLADYATTDLGLDLGSWRLLSAVDVSADGRTITGTGINPLGSTEAFILNIPAPGSAVVFIPLAMLTRRETGRG